MQTSPEAPKKKLPPIVDVAEPAAAAAPAPKKSPPAAAPAVPAKFVPSQLLDVELIEPDPENPRKDFPKEEMQQLTASVALRGVEQAIEVRPVVGGRYRITFGERRWRAAKAAGLKQIPATVKPRTDLDAADVQLAENLDRADLSPLEIAGGYQRQLTLGRTMDQVCERAGKKRSAVYATLQLLQLGPEGRKALGEEKISSSVAQLVARVPKSMQQKALSLVSGDHWSEPMAYRDAVVELEGAFIVDLKKAPFDTKDEKLCPAAGSCVKCPKRTGNAKDLYPDAKSPDGCTDKPCYDEKVYADLKKVHEAKGYALLKPKDAPAEELFWNDGAGALKSDKYIEPDTVNYDDTQNRKYRDLLPLEQFKELAVVAIDSNGKPRQLLPKAGLARELKKGGIFKEKTKRQAAAPAPAKSSKPAVYKPPPPHVDELTDNALIAEIVAAVEKKGLTPALVRQIAVHAIRRTEHMFERRGVKASEYTFSEKDLDKNFSKPKPGPVAGILFEAAVLDGLWVDGDSDALEAVAKEHGIDPKKVRARVELASALVWEKKPGGDEIGKGQSGTRFNVSKEGKTFALVWTPAAGGQKGVEKQQAGLKSLELAKAEAARLELGLSKKGGGK